MVQQAHWNAKLSGARSYQRLLETLDGMGRTFLCLSALALVCYHLDRWLVFSSPARLAWLISFILASLACALAFVLRPLVRRIADEDIALQVERRYPQLQERLLSTVEFAHAAAGHGVSGRMIAALMQQTDDETRPLKFTDAIARPQLRRVAALCAAMLVILSAHVVFARAPMARWLQRMLNPYGDIPVFAFTQLDVQPRNCVLPRGADLTVTVTTDGSRATSCDLYVQREGGDWEKRTARPHAPTPTLFRYRLSNLTTSLRYYARANDGQSNTYTAEVVDRPAIVGVRVRYRYPAYTRKASEVVQEGAGNITALVGTRVTVEMTANKPVHAASLLLDGKMAGNWTTEDERVWGSLLVRKDSTYTVRLRDEHGFTNLDPPQYTIQAVQDRSPEVTLTRPKTDLELVPDATLPLSATARDDYGIAALRLRHDKERGDKPHAHTPTRPYAHMLPLSVPSPPRPSVTSAARWNLAALDLQAGDVLTFFVEARDNDNVTGPHVGKSEVRRVRIVSHEEMEMRLNALAADVRQMLDRIIQRQRETKSQTERAQANPRQPAMSAARSAQTDIARETAEVAQRLGELVEQAENNAMTPPEEVQPQREAQQGLQDLAQREMPQATQSIERAESTRNRAAQQRALSQATQQQQQILDRLQQLRESLENRSDAERLAAQARELAQREQALAQQAEMLAPNMLRRPSNELPSGQRNLLEQMAQEQRAIRESTERLQQELQEAVGNGRRAVPPAQAERMNQAAQQMQQQRFSERQQNVESQLQQNQLPAAAPEANRLAQDLQRLAQTLQPPNPSQPNAAEMAQQFQEMAERLGKLAKQQQDVVRQTEQRPNASQSQRLAETERSIQREAERLGKLAKEMARQSPSAGNMRENLQEASRQLGRAQPPLARNQPQQALPSERAAQRALEQAQREAEDAAAQMRLQQQAEQLRQQLRDLAARQRGIHQATQRLHRTQEERGTLPGNDAREAQQTARAQGDLAQATQQLQERMPSQVFRNATGEAARSMSRAQQNLERQQLGQPTQREQERAARLLEGMADALEGQSQQGQSQSGQPPRGMGQAQRELQGALGDLRVLREMERHLNEETRDFEQRRPPDEQNLTPEQQRDLEQLSQRQGNTASMTNRAARRLRAFPQFSRPVEQAGSEMRQAQGQLQQEQTGEPAQQPQREAIRHLEQAAGRLEQALQQQQAQQLAQRAQQQRQRANQPALDSHFVQGSDEGGERSEIAQRLRGFGNLPPRAQRALREGAKEKVPAEYENLINQYYKALAKEKRK